MLAATSGASRLPQLDLFDLAIAAPQPGLYGVVVIDRVDATDFAQALLGWLRIITGVHGARLQHQFLTVPVEVEVEARHRLVEHGGFQSCGLPVAAAVERDIDAF